LRRSNFFPLNSDGFAETGQEILRNAPFVDEIGFRIRSGSAPFPSADAGEKSVNQSLTPA
jgi:hypothetical protein